MADAFRHGHFFVKPDLDAGNGRSS
jgi:hypothetical protein